VAAKQTNLWVATSVVETNVPSLNAEDMSKIYSVSIFASGFCNLAGEEAAPTRECRAG
jgi:hypothetical protein